MRSAQAPDRMIVSADGVPTPSIRALRRQIRKTEVGDAIRLEVLRGSSTIHREVRVAEIPGALVG